MIQRASQTQMYLHNNNYNTELNPCQVYNPALNDGTTIHGAMTIWNRLDSSNVLTYIVTDSSNKELIGKVILIPINSILYSVKER